MTRTIFETWSDFVRYIESDQHVTGTTRIRFEVHDNRIILSAEKIDGSALEIEVGPSNPIREIPHWQTRCLHRSMPADSATIEKWHPRLLSYRS